MARPLLQPQAHNATIHELKEAARVGSSETALRCPAFQMLVVGINREQVCQALLVTNRALRKWINAFNKSGVDGLIARKRPGRTAIITGDTARELTKLIDTPQSMERTFWTAKAFHGYISESYQIECSYQTVVRFFHQQGFALKVPRPWPDHQDEKQREMFRQNLKQLSEQDDVDLWIADESGFEGDPRPRKRWDRKGSKTTVTKNGDHRRMNVMGMFVHAPGNSLQLKLLIQTLRRFKPFSTKQTESSLFKDQRIFLFWIMPPGIAVKQQSGMVGSQCICHHTLQISIPLRESGW